MLKLITKTVQKFSFVIEELYFFIIIKMLFHLLLLSFVVALAIANYFDCQLVQGTRSLLIRPPTVQTTVTAAVATSTTQVLLLI